MGINVICSVIWERVSKLIKLLLAERFVIKKEAIAGISALSYATLDSSANHFLAKPKL